MAWQGLKPHLGPLGTQLAGSLIGGAFGAPTLGMMAGTGFAGYGLWSGGVGATMRAPGFAALAGATGGQLMGMGPLEGALAGVGVAAGVGLARGAGAWGAATFRNPFVSGASVARNMGLGVRWAAGAVPMGIGLAAGAAGLGLLGMAVADQIDTDRLAFTAQTAVLGGLAVGAPIAAGVGLMSLSGRSLTSGLSAAGTAAGGIRVGGALLRHPATAVVGLMAASSIASGIGSLFATGAAQEVLEDEYGRFLRGGHDPLNAGGMTLASHYNANTFSRGG